MKNYITYSKIVFILFILSLLFATISFISTLIKSNIYIDLSSKGFLDFYNHYQATVLILGIGLTLLTLWATFEKIDQTGRQIQFSNFYKHREEFINTYFQHPLIVDISNANQCDQKVILYDVYSTIYYKTFKEFQPCVNKEFNENIKSLIMTINNSELNQKFFDLRQIDQIKLSKIRYLIPTTFLNYIFRHSQVLQVGFNPELNEAIRFDETRKEVVNSFSFIMLHDLHNVLRLIRLLLAYDNITIEQSPYFNENFFLYRHELGIPLNPYKE